MILGKVFEPCIILKPEVIDMAATARIDSFCKIEGGEGLTIGEYVHIASFVHINTGGGRVIIEDGASFATGSKIVGGGNTVKGLSMSASAPSPWQDVDRSKTTRIGKYATILTNAVVLTGVAVGEGAILAAGGVATKNIPPYEIWGGVPAKKIGERNREELQGCLWRHR
jgi:galactoside O-acetyltransferase